MNSFDTAKSSLVAIAIAKVSIRMWMFFLLLLSGATNPLASWSQATGVSFENKLEFDAVSIRQVEAYKRESSPGSTSYIFTRHQPCTYTQDKVICRLALGELVFEAFQRKKYEVLGPSWLMDDVFVFEAILPGKTSKEDARIMIQNALKDRFHLQCHTEKRSLPVYEMVTASGGIRLNQVSPADSKRRLTVPGAPPSSIINMAGRFSAVAIGLDELGRWVERSAGLDRPVLNGTGLTQLYDIDLRWDPANDSNSLMTRKDTGIVNALNKQAGLILHKEDLPTEVLMIDHVNRLPSPN